MLGGRGAGISKLSNRSLIAGSGDTIETVFKSDVTERPAVVTVETAKHQTAQTLLLFCIFGFTPNLKVTEIVSIKPPQTSWNLDNKTMNVRFSVQILFPIPRKNLTAG